MGRLFDPVLNGSLSFYGIATAAFLPLIVAGGLTLLAFTFATLAAFQKRPGQKSAKALPQFGTLWILGLTAIVLSTAQTPTAQAATSPSQGIPSIPISEDAIWERIGRELWGDRSGVATAQQAGVYIYKASSTYKSWYEFGKLLKHNTAKQKSDGTIIAEDHLTEEEEDGVEDIKERRFGMYDYFIAHRRTFKSRSGYGNRYREPSSYYKRYFEFASPGWNTIKWDCNYVVKSSYTNTNGDQRLNANPPCPKTYKIEVTYKLASLDTVRQFHVRRTPYEKESTWKGDFKTMQDDEKTNVNLLRRNTEMYEEPTAVGSCKRDWEWRIIRNPAPPLPGVAAKAHLPFVVDWYIDVTIQPKKEGE